ncbi:MAG: hypothetical protein R3C61_10855 [Bacteroidia bacterium]
MSKPIASLSLDLDDQWTYMKTHGDPGWESYPSYHAYAVPRILDFLDAHDTKITFLSSHRMRPLNITGKYWPKSPAEVMI